MRLQASMFALSLTLCSCHSATPVEKLGAVQSPRADRCAISFIDRKAQLAGYTVIGKIESHIEKNFFFGGKATLADDAHRELRIKACRLGGDAVVVDDSIESSAAEMSYVHVWATVLKRIP